MTTFLLGVDCGSTMAKAALFDEHGNEIAVASQKIDHIYLHPGWTENDMTSLWDSVCGVISQVIRTSGVDAKNIAAVCCAGHGNGLYLVGKDGRPVRNGIISSDNRARKYIEEWTARDVLSTVLPKTMQSLWPAQPNALLRWLLDNEPESLQHSRWVFMCKDYIRYCLTGEAFMELTDMSGTSLMDVGKACYDDEILDTWGLSSLKHLLPPLRKSADICGTVTETAAKRTGLAVGTPVAGGLFDIDACGLAVGMTNETQFCIVAGTWGNNQFIAQKPVVDRDVFMTSCYCIDGYYLMLEGSATSASNFEWFVSQFLVADKELLRQQAAATSATTNSTADSTTTAATSAKNIYTFCNELIAATKPEDTGILFLPYLFACPTDMDGKGCLFGLDGRHTRGQVLRAVFEGIVFGHFWHFQRLLRFREKPATLRLTGGAMNSDVWAQMFADIFQIPVQIPQGSELGCFGAAICGAVAVGLYPSYDVACDKMVSLSRTFVPNPDLAAIYRKKYEHFEKLLSTLSPVWKELVW